MGEPNNKNGGLTTALVVIIVKLDRGQSFIMVSGDRSGKKVKCFTFIWNIQ